MVIRAVLGRTARNSLFELIDKENKHEEDLLVEKKRVFKARDCAERVKCLLIVEHIEA